MKKKRKKSKALVGVSLHLIWYPSLKFTVNLLRCMAQQCSAKSAVQVTFNLGGTYPGTWLKGAHLLIKCVVVIPCI